jgi:hypothetical protein
MDCRRVGGAADEKEGPQVADNDTPNDAETTEPEGGERAAEDPWTEVGEQLAALGQSIAGAFTATVQSEENRRRAQELKERMNSAGESIAAAGAKTAEQVRPHILSALKTANEELRKLTERMEKAHGTEGTPGTGEMPDPADKDAYTPGG